MLKKHNGINIPNDDPFENDKLNREPLIENLTRLITDLNQPFVISINSPWGTGKTVFIKMWEQYLKNKNFVTLYFNAWENDFANEPLISLIGEIKGQLAKDQKGNSDLKKCTDNLLKKGSKIIKQSLPVLSKVLVKSLLKIEDVKELTDSIKLDDLNEDVGDFIFEKVEKKIEEYTANRDIQKEFRDVLTKFSEAVIKKDKKNRPIVFFVDELDRCRPDYAIKLLESIKHLFNINNFVFVLAIDRKQIGYSVQTLYGTGMDTEGYLKRFIDINYNLPEPSRKDYIEFLYDVYAFSEIKINSHVRGDPKELFLSVFSSIVDLFELSLREIEHCLTYMRIVWRILDYIDEASLYLMCFLVPLRIKEVDLCNDYSSGRINSEHLLTELSKKLKKPEKFFKGFEWHTDQWFGLKFDHNIGIILEYFLETAQIDNYQAEQKYKERFPNDTPGIEKLREIADVDVAKQIIKKWLSWNMHISATKQSFTFLKKALDFASKIN